ncbi:hypothetical protein [Pseudomonas poae]|uniref:Uncharacterized protein n=1 Tax=Pseudomonas poae TaxID=200451 RepID=A0A2S9EUJ1_9PSED|nr:hypothetical protein [Pseudomonas poae]PRA33762.1 hypothetical protein CQZ97_00720 [Pseudomonas poae]PRC19648.1 hypothetical protein CQZ99_09885 [Pseudomonas poae]
MSDVKRWYIGVYDGEAQARVCAPHPHEFIRDTEGEIFVLAEQFDACEARNRALQQLLTAADEELDRAGGAYLNKNAECLKLRDRARVLEGLLRRCQPHLPRYATALRTDLYAELKPAEPATCCTVSAGNQALLDAGDYTPEELFGIGGKPSCPKCAP